MSPPAVSILAALVGCPHKAAHAPADAVLPAAPAVAVPTRTPLTGPTYWSESGGLCLEVPAGWSGTSGPAPQLLDLAFGDTGFGLEIRAYPSGDPPPDRPGFDLLFEDRGTYRSVPLLGDGAATRSWIAIDPNGPMAQSWYGPLGDRTVELVLIYPHGRATEGEELLAPVLASICTTWRRGS